MTGFSIPLRRHSPVRAGQIGPTYTTRLNGLFSRLLSNEPGQKEPRSPLRLTASQSLGQVHASCTDIETQIESGVLRRYVLRERTNDLK